MNPIKYLREKGIKHSLEVFYKYKIDLILQGIMKPFLKNKPLKNIIMLESHNDFDCNGGAFYDYLIKNGYNKKYKIVWILKHPEKRPKPLPKNVEWVPLFRPSIKKIYFNYRAKYLLADCYIQKKLNPHQISVYLTHGGVLALKSVVGKENVPASVDYVLGVAECYDEIARKELSMNRQQKFLHIGYPAQDNMFLDSSSELVKITDRHFSKIILWMPTFRKGGGYNRNDSTRDFPLGIPLIESKEQLKRIDEYLKENNTLLIIKIHPMQDPKTILDLQDSEQIVVLDGDKTKKLNLNIYALFKEVDAMISDYSSSIYQFMPLNRPVAFMLSDLQDYKLGLSVSDPEAYMPGEKIYDYGDFSKFISDVCNGIDPYKNEREAFITKMFPYRDQFASKRLSQFLGIEPQTSRT